MKAAVLAVALFAASAYASEFEDYGLADQSEARFLSLNMSSTAGTLTLLGVAILLGVIGYLVYAGGLLGGSAYNRNDYAQGYDQQYYDPSQYAQQYRWEDTNPQ